MQPASPQDWLERFLKEHGGIAGSVHLLSDDELVMRASVNLPPPVVRATERIPKGKGMAGLAWERNSCVATCNLKTDTSGDVRPGAKAVDATAALAIPVRDTQGVVNGVVGIAFAGERDFGEPELQAFERAAASIAAVTR